MRTLETGVLTRSMTDPAAEPGNKILPWNEPGCISCSSPPERPTSKEFVPPTCRKPPATLTPELLMTDKPPLTKTDPPAFTLSWPDSCTEPLKPSVVAPLMASVAPYPIGT
jgi:hypothetical protein